MLELMPHLVSGDLLQASKPISLTTLEFWLMVIDISSKALKRLFKSTRILSTKRISRMLESSSQVRLKLSKVAVMVAASDARPSVPMDKSHRLLSPTVITCRLSMPNSRRTRRRHFTSFDTVANDSVGIAGTSGWLLLRLMPC
jgi:hypothetical protein